MAGCIQSARSLAGCIHTTTTSSNTLACPYLLSLLRSSPILPVLSSSIHLIPSQTYDDLSEDDEVIAFEDLEEEIVGPARTRARVVIVPPVDALEIVEAEPVHRSSRRSNTTW